MPRIAFDLREISRRISAKEIFIRGYSASMFVMLRHPPYCIEERAAPLFGEAAKS